MAHPLDGVRAKIERSEKHLDKFCRDARLFETGSYIVRTEKDFEKGAISFFAQDAGLGDPPTQLVLLAGEIAYQLRSALDHLVYQLILVNHNTPNRKRQFPIFETWEEYKTRARTMIEGVSSASETTIEALQPYHRRGSANQHPLWMLHDLNNTDKHRLIPICLMVGNSSRVTFPNGEYSEFNLVVYPPSPLKDGAKLYTFPAANPQVDVNAELHCFVAFQQIGGSKYEPVIPFLRQAITHVEAVVGSFRVEFL